jgi:hypothetical protein
MATTEVAGRLPFSATGRPGSDLLQQPPVTVRVVEGRERDGGAAVGRGSGHPADLTKSSPWRALVEHLAHLHTMSEQFVPCGVDVGHDQVQALCRAGCSRREVDAKLDRAAGAWRRELHQAEVIGRRPVGIESPPEARVGCFARSTSETGRTTASSLSSPAFGGGVSLLFSLLTSVLLIVTSRSCGPRQRALAARRYRADTAVRLRPSQ